LSDGLYSNKVKAIIRELSCNAIDSHVAAGKKHEPFEVHLPTVLEPWFSVRDFGIGLNGDQVVNIYTTYFESTKTDSNDYIGALGLGSKSPFSYTENFTVTAIKDGIVRIYSAYINQSGIPCVAEMSEALTSEANGVEVKFSVTDRHDYYRFADEATAVFKWFTNKPTITGNQIEIPEVQYKEKNIVPGVHIGKSGSWAVMGNIAYPLQAGNIPGAEKVFGNLAGLLHENLILEFDIGEVDFAASREELSFVPLTLNSIKKKFELLNASLASHVAAKADVIDHPWERAFYLKTSYQQKLYSAAVVKYVTDTKFELFDEKCYNGSIEFKHNTKDLADAGLEISVFATITSGAQKRNPATDWSATGGRLSHWSVPITPEVVFVLNDLKTGCLARARYHFTKGTNYKYGTHVYCVSHSSSVLSERQDAYDVLMKSMHNPPTVIKASELDKRPTPEKLESQGVVKMRKKVNSRGYSTDEYTWEPCNHDFSEAETHYFVLLSGYKALSKDGKTENDLFFRTVKLMKDCGIADISNIKIYGVRKSMEKEIQALDNWVWYEDELNEEIVKISDSHVISLVVSEMLDSYTQKVHTNTDVAKKLPKTSLYAEFVNKYMLIKRATGNISELVELCAVYGKAVQVDDVKKKISDAKSELYKQYPLLKHLGDASVDNIVDYVKLIDSKEKN
jgi:hypothetical protein